MNIEDLKNTVKDIVAKADILKSKIVKEPVPVNYACIFCQSKEEYTSFLETTKQIGTVVQETKAGPVFQIASLPTIAGNLQLLKIRKPDPTRPERGDADFTLLNYEEFKKEHLSQPGFSLIQKEQLEMIEYMEPDSSIRVYFSNPPLDKQLGII
ncbi:TPA: hypothetical protein DCZ15_00670 [Candidatus Falkowbacteria bacterium]|nr:hypothetical protein [Candidatus Falkowbacteria bacterium]